MSDRPVSAAAREKAQETVIDWIQEVPSATTKLIPTSDLERLIARFAAALDAFAAEQVAGERAVALAGQVAKLAERMTSPFKEGVETACEEIIHRLIAAGAPALVESEESMAIRARLTPAPPATEPREAHETDRGTATVDNGLATPPETVRRSGRSTAAEAPDPGMAPKEPSKGGDEPSRAPVPSDAQRRVVEALALEAASELERAQAKFPRFNGPHEGYAVILEELDELWDEVKASKPGGDRAAMRNEAIQVAAMALRFVRDVCGAADRSERSEPPQGRRPVTPPVPEACAREGVSGPCAWGDDVTPWLRVRREPDGTLAWSPPEMNRTEVFLAVREKAERLEQQAMTLREWLWEATR